MAKGYFADDQATLVLTEVVQNVGTYPQQGAGQSTDDYVGLVRTFAFSFAPGGYLANGQRLSDSSESTLFSVERYQYGATVTTFQVPDLQGRVTVGSSLHNGILAGTDTTSVTPSQFPASFGGTSQQVAIGGPSETLTYLICTSGYFPSQNSTVPEAFLGEVVPWTGTFVPAGFAVADGSTLPIQGNEALFTVLGTTYGGNGTSTFKLPNLVGSDIVGAGDSATGSLALGATVGQASVTLTQANLPAANGGSGQAFNDQSPGLGLYYIINVSSGIFPQRDNQGGYISSGEPVLGEVKAFAGPSQNIPQGWVVAAGQTLSVKSFTALFTLLGTTYGGNGSTSFQLPDLVGKVVAGSGTRNGTGYSTGQLFGSNTTNLVVTDTTVVCFAAGTAIRTPGGDRPVETLAAGDAVLTASGVRRRVKWTGHRVVDCARHPDSAAVMPVRIDAGAFGPGLPERDLWLSPGHAVCGPDGTLIPAHALCNGATVRQVEVDRVTYWHVELDSHDILLANGLQAESYMDVGNRRFFAEADAVDLHAVPDAAPGSLADYCRPFAEHGPAVEAARALLRTEAARLGWTLHAAPAAGMHLVADGVRVDPAFDGRIVRFALPAGTARAWLVSDAAAPCDVSNSGDLRRLGLDIQAIGIEGAGGIALDHPLLCAGWHGLEDAAGTPHRWTTGKALLPAALWDGSGAAPVLWVELAGPAIPQWCPAPNGLARAA